MNIKTDIPNLTLETPLIKEARELFSVVDANRAFLKQWLPWLDINRSWRDSREFIAKAKALNHEGKALHCLLKWHGKIVGAGGFDEIESSRGAGLIGYWLAQDWNGRGFITASIRTLMEYSSQNMGLQRFVIHAAVDNVRSRAVAERLGFKLVCVAPQQENLYGVLHDRAVYEWDAASSSMRLEKGIKS